MSHIHDLQKALYSHLPTIAAPHRRIAEVVLPQMVHDHASFRYVRLGALSHVISRVRSEVAVSVPTKSWCVCVGLEEAEPLPLPRKQICGCHRRRISRSCALSALAVLEPVLCATVVCSVLVQIAQQIKPSTQFHSSLKYRFCLGLRPGLMAYAARLKKHHVRFQAAVLRNLFDSPSPPPLPPPPAPTSSRTSEILIDARLPDPEFQSTQTLRDEICFHEAPQTTEPDSNVTEDFCDSKETKITKPFLKRSQRRRLKLKNLKESLVESGERKRFVGPLLPISMDMEHGQRLCDSIGPVEVENRDTKEYQSQAGLNTCIDLEHGKEEQLCNPGTHMEISTETDGCDPRVSLSRTKKRRLAKKKCSSDVNRHLQQGSIFTAEIKGESFIVKKI